MRETWHSRPGAISGKVPPGGRARRDVFAAAARRIAAGYLCGVYDVEQLLWLRPEVTVTVTFTR